MAIDAVLSSLEGVDDGLRDQYVERDGKFFLDVKPVEGYELRNVTNLNKAMESERSRAQEASKKLKELETRFGDLDPEAARAALKKIEELGDDEDVDSKVNSLLEQRQQQLEKKFADQTAKIKSDLEKERDQALKQNQTMQQQLEKTMLHNEALQAVTAEKGKPALLMPVIKSMTTMKQQDDGTFQVVVLDPATGNERLSTKSGSSELMSIQELVQELKQKEDYGAAFDGGDATGGGSSGASSSGASIGGSITITEAQMRDPSQYRRLRERAAKEGKSLIPA